METVLLMTGYFFKKQKATAISDLILSKFLESCLNLDAAIFEPYINEDDYFEDVEKYTFLYQLHGLFEEFRKDTLDDFTVKMKHSECKGCAKGKPVYRFEVYNNDTKIMVNDFAFLIDMRDGVLNDIYRCYDFAGCRTVKIGGGKQGLPEIEVSLPLLIKSRKEYLERLANKV